MLKRLLILPFAAASLAACADPAAPTAAAAAPVADASRPAKLGLCVACHGEDGISRAPGTPHLAGQDRQYLERALGDYRSGKRQQVPMTSLANSLQPVDVQALAAWYAAQPGFAKGATR